MSSRYPLELSEEKKMSSMYPISDKPIQLPPFKVLLIYTHFVILSFSGETIEEAREKAIKVFKEQYPNAMIGARWHVGNSEVFTITGCYESEDSWRTNGRTTALLVEVNNDA